MRRQGVEDRKSKTPLINPASKARQKLSKTERREQAEAAFLAATQPKNVTGKQHGLKIWRAPILDTNTAPSHVNFSRRTGTPYNLVRHPAAAVWGCIDGTRHGSGTKAKPSVSHPGGFAVSEITNNARLREIFALGSPNSLGSLAILSAIRRASSLLSNLAAVH